MVGKRELCVGFLHSVAATVEPMLRLGQEFCTRRHCAWRFVNIVDEFLLDELGRGGSGSSVLSERLLTHVSYAKSQGADAVVSFCSSLSPALELLDETAAIPVVTVDRRAFSECASKWRHILLVATSPTTLEPSTSRLRRIAVQVGAEVEVQPLFCEDAVTDYYSGRIDAHDSKVLRCLGRAHPGFEGVLLAQASLSHLVPRIRSLGYEAEACAPWAFEEVSDRLAERTSL